MTLLRVDEETFGLLRDVQKDLQIYGKYETFDEVIRELSLMYYGRGEE